MTSQQQIIVICVIAVVAVPVGTFTAIKCIKKLTRTPVNGLTRRHGDLELVDYIVPTEPQNTYLPNRFDLINPQYPEGVQRISFLTDQSNINHHSIGYPPSYSIGYPPSYHTHTENDYFIHSCLENESMNIVFIFIIIITILITLYLFIKTNKQNVNFNQVSNLIQYSLIPFSLFNIDFRDSFEWELNSYRDKAIISYLRIQTLTVDIQSLLNSLNDDVNYSMSLSYISSYEKWKDNKEKVVPIFVDDAIIINKNSDPFLITQFIMNTLNEKNYFITDWLFKGNLINSMDSMIISVIIPIKVKI